MEQLVDKGLCKAIGISNFTTKKIQTLLDTARIAPACNQGMSASRNALVGRKENKRTFP